MPSRVTGEIIPLPTIHLATIHSQSNVRTNSLTVRPLPAPAVVLPRFPSAVRNLSTAPGHAGSTVSKLAGTHILPSILSSWDQAGSDPTGEKIAGAMYNGILDFDANIRASYPHVSLSSVSLACHYPAPNTVPGPLVDCPSTLLCSGLLSLQCSWRAVSFAMLAADWAQSTTGWLVQSIFFRHYSSGASGTTAGRP